MVRVLVAEGLSKFEAEACKVETRLELEAKGYVYRTRPSLS
jgi:hypothetical protein